MMKTLFKTFALVFSFCAAVYTAPVAAQAYPSTAWVWANTVTGNVTRYAATTASAANAASFTFGPAANGVYASSAQSLAYGAGRGLPVSVVSRLAPATVARAVASSLIPGVGAVVVGAAVLALLSELKYAYGTNPDGTVSLTKSVETGGFNYSAPGGGTWPTMGQLMSEWTKNNPTYNGQTVSGVSATEGAFYVYSNGSIVGVVSVDKSPAPITTTSVPKTVPEFESDLTQAVGAGAAADPIEDKAAKAVAEVVKDRGVAVPVPAPQSVTGPTSVSGSPTTTTNPDGSKVTVTPSTSFDYAPDGVTVTDKTTTVTTSPTGEPTGTTTTETPSQPATPPEPTPDPCEANPDRIGCSKYGTPDTPSIEKTNSVVSVTAVAFASSAGCPAALSFSVIGRPYSFSYDPLCDQLGALKNLFVAIAGFMAAYILANSFRV